MQERNALRSVSGIALMLAVLLSGCSLLGEAVMDGIAGGFREGVGRSDAQGKQPRSEQSGQAEKEPASETGSSESSAIGPQWNQLMTAQAQMAFSYAFSAGGMWAGQVGYEPGEYTKFEWSAKGDDSMVMERAYLRALDDGTQWWRVSWEGTEGLWVWETLIDPQSGQMLRMRGRDADGNVGEVPLAGQGVYAQPVPLAEGRVGSAATGKTDIDVPAGRFQTDHVAYMAGTGEVKVEFWLTPRVPGGVVRYSISTKDEGTVWDCELTDFGKGATTILESF